MTVFNITRDTNVVFVEPVCRGNSESLGGNSQNNVKSSCLFLALCRKVKNGGLTFVHFPCQQRMLLWVLANPIQGFFLKREPISKILFRNKDLNYKCLNFCIIGRFLYDAKSVCINDPIALNDSRDLPYGELFRSVLRWLFLNIWGYKGRMVCIYPIFLSTRYPT